MDFEAVGLAISSQTALARATEVYNCAGAYRFGMTNEEARHANVDAVPAVVRFAAGLPRVGRLVHVSGYRVGGQASNGAVDGRTQQEDVWGTRRVRSLKGRGR